MVEKLEAEEITEGALSGKMALYGWIAPTDDLVTMTSNWQKLFTSMEVNTSFADTGSAYLVGLAITDDPASLGTEMLQFSASAEHNPWRAASWTKTTCLPLLLKRSLSLRTCRKNQPVYPRKELLSRKSADDNARFADVNQAVETIAREHQTLAEQVSTHQTDFSNKLSDLQKVVDETTSALSTLREQLSTQDSRSERRPNATGNNGAEQTTDC